jgi:hypothetical protein
MRHPTAPATHLGGGGVAVYAVHIPVLRWPGGAVGTVFSKTHYQVPTTKLSKTKYQSIQYRIFGNMVTDSSLFSH